MVKKTIVSVVVLVVLAGVAIVTTAHWQDSKNKQQKHEDTRVRTAVAKEQASAQAERTKLAKQLEQMRYQCQLGANSYVKLPANIQKAVPAPKCDAVLL